MEQTPAYWQTDLDTIERWAARVKRAEVEVIGRSAGGRPIYAFCYGKARPFASRANYNSACGARDRSAFAPLAGKTPVLLLIGAEHGSETEGVAAIMNAIALLETGVDLAGRENPGWTQAAQALRLVLVPVANPDGRARVVPASSLGQDRATHRYWAQGTWRDGTLCEWPDCKRVHPILDAVSFLGGYFNDQGVNPMHDQFFHPMAPEAQAVLDLAAREYADWVLHLHGGSNSMNELLQPAYVPREIGEAIRRLATRCDQVAQGQDLRFEIGELPGKEQGDPPPSFNLCSATHHACGCVSAIFESNQCVLDMPGNRLTHDEVYLSHMILFEQCARMMCEERVFQDEEAEHHADRDMHNA